MINKILGMEMPLDEMRPFQLTWGVSPYSLILSTATMFVSTSDVIRTNQFKVWVIYNAKLGKKAEVYDFDQT